MKFPINPSLFASVVCFILLGSIAFAQTPSPTHKVIFVSQTKDAGWQDLAFLASVPASRISNQGNGAVIAIDETGKIPIEVEDYLRRLNPFGIFHLGEKPLNPAPKFGKYLEIPCSSADQAAIALANSFWKSSQRVVLCREDDYASALMASTLAARIKAPLLFSGSNGLSAETTAAIEKLKAKEWLFVGQAPDGMKATALADLPAILNWLKSQKLKTPYLAITNVRDRSSTTIRKLSLTAPLFAAANEGMVFPIDDEIRWRVPFKGKPIQGAIPAGLPASSKPQKSGVMELAEGKIPFVVSYEANGANLLSLDLDGNGTYDGTNEKPLRTNGVVTLLGKPRTLNFGEKSGSDCDVSVTTGSAEDVVGKLKKLYAQTTIPRYLCIVGFPDCIPQAILTRGKNDITSDLPYANTDDDLFSEIAVGRIIAENLTYATLHASRTLTYQLLLDPSWLGKAGQARWENTMVNNFQNVGLDTSAYHKLEDLPWTKPPAGNKPGKRADSFSQDSPLTKVAFLSHMDHSWWKGLGHTFDLNSSTLLSPVVVESGGCLTANLDYEPDFRSVISRLFRNGAISFSGQTREGIAQQEQQRAEFWNGIFKGKSLGEAHRSAQNSKASLVIEKNQLKDGPDHYQLHIRSLFGDPAFVPRLPAKEKSAPARTEVTENTVSVFAPAKWWKVKMFVPEDWKLWADKPLYVIRGAGTFPNRYWFKDGYDCEETFTSVEYTTPRKIKSITQTQQPPAPLGWTGKHTVDPNPDGTFTYRWRVRLIDFDQTKGEIINQIDRIDYRIEFE